MKNLYLLIFFALTVFSSYGQTKNDHAQILKECMDLPSIQPYLAVDADGNIQQITINYWHPLFFPTDLEVTKAGKSIQYVAMSTNAGKNGDVFFLFNTFRITGNSATVQFDYHYGSNNCSKLLQVNMDLVKTDESWKVLKSSLNKQE